MREALDKVLVKEEEKISKASGLLKIYSNTKKNLENEINGYISEARRQRQTIEQMDRDVQRYDREAEEANQAYYTALEERSNTRRCSSGICRNASWRGRRS